MTAGRSASWPRRRRPSRWPPPRGADPEDCSTRPATPPGSSTASVPSTRHRRPATYAGLRTTSTTASSWPPTRRRRLGSRRRSTFRAASPLASSSKAHQGGRVELAQRRAHHAGRGGDADHIVRLVAPGQDSCPTSTIVRCRRPRRRSSWRSARSMPDSTWASPAIGLGAAASSAGPGQRDVDVGFTAYELVAGRHQRGRRTGHRRVVAGRSPQPCGCWPSTSTAR